jgi:hypothetical protein
MTVSAKTDPTMEYPLPHNADAERAILGSILLGAKNVDEILSQLQLDDLFLPEHRVIFRHMTLLRKRGSPLDDLVVLHESLNSADELEKAGGTAYVSKLSDGLPRLSNVLHHVEIVKLKAHLRKKAVVAENILKMALGANGNASDVLSDISNLSAQLREDVGQKRILRFRSGAEIAATEEKVDWIVPGFVAKGAITELGAKVKTGKTTLLLSLIRAISTSDRFFDRPTLRTPTVYLTEQPTASLIQAMDRASLLGREDFYVLQHADAHGLSWPTVAAEAVKECGRVGAMVLVIDTLSHFAGLKGDAENNAGDALEAMVPLLQAAAAGIGVVVARHERKSGGDVGDSGRGSSAFAGAVDIVLSLRKPEGNAQKTLRVLHALSRFSETPPELLIEFVDGGYVAVGDPQEAAIKQAKNSILAISPEKVEEAIGLRELAETAKVPRATTQRALEDLLVEGSLDRTGKGKRGSPYLYFRRPNRFCSTSYIEGQKEKANC